MKRYLGLIVIVLGVFLFIPAQATAECIWGSWSDSSGNHYCPPDCGGNPDCNVSGGGTSPGTGGGFNQRQWEQEQEMLRLQRQREAEAREREQNRKAAHAAEEEGRKRAWETERKLRQEQARAAGQLKGGGTGQLQIRSGTAVMGLKNPNPTGSLQLKGISGAGATRSISREWKQAHCGMWIAGFAIPAARKGDVGEVRYLRGQVIKVFSGGSAELGCPATPPPPEVVGRAVTGKDSPVSKFHEALLAATIRQAEVINEANKTLLMAKIRKSAIEKETLKNEKKKKQLESEIKQAEAKKPQLQSTTDPVKDEVLEKKKRLLAEALAALKKSKKAASDVDAMIAKADKVKKTAEAKLTAYGKLSQQAQAKPSIAGKLTTMIGN